MLSKHKMWDEFLLKNHKMWDNHGGKEEFPRKGAKPGLDSEIGVCKTVGWKEKPVILSGARSAESKNLRIWSTFAVHSVPRSFDSLALAQDDKLFFNILPNYNLLRI